MARKIILLALVLLAVWIGWDLAAPRRVDFRAFDPQDVGRLDGAMWRAYYERRPLRLFLQLSALMRRQFHAPFWRSFPIAYRAAQAAFVFKDGRNRTEYTRALPCLERYYGALRRLSDRPFDVPRVAALELEWWIIRREADRFTPADWERIHAEAAGQFYALPAERFTRHARLRVEAMRLRDQLGDRIGESDWKKIEALLREAWSSLHRVVNEAS